jgi:hypothetical protein
MPLDALTAARLARDGEKASPVRHMCSGQHSVFLLLSRLKGWDPERYWLDDHPAQVAYREVVALSARRPRGCGRRSTAVASPPTFPARDRPGVCPAGDPSAVTSRSSLAPTTRVRDAIFATHQEMIRDPRPLDTSLMRRRPDGGCGGGGGPTCSPSSRPAGRHERRTANGGRQRRQRRPRGQRCPLQRPCDPGHGIALKIGDGDGYERGPGRRRSGPRQASFLNGG